MKVNFNGFDEKVLTFKADNTLTDSGQWVKITSNGCVGKADANSALVGNVVNIRNGYCGVMVSGTVTAKKSGTIALGYSHLVYTANGITQNSAGREHLVLSVDDENVTFIL